MAAISPRKAFKICDFQRRKRKGVVVGNLEELKLKASDAFMIELDSCRVYLDSDGTEIDDDEYLGSLPDQTVLVVTDGEDWSVNKAPDLNMHTSSFSISSELNESLEVQDDTDSSHPISDFVLQQIKRNPLYFMSFSDEQLLSVIDCDVDFLARGLERTQHEVNFYQEACQRELDKRTEMQRASDLLWLYDKGMKANRKVPESKKQRTENSTAHTHKRQDN